MFYNTERKFFIKKNSTLPVLKYPLNQHLLERYDITNEMMGDVAVTFSMINEDTGIYYIANVEAQLIISNDRPMYPDEVKYTLAYQFNVKETSKIGLFRGEFKLDFLGENCGKITIPTDGKIVILISDSITKTTVV